MSSRGQYLTELRRSNAAGIHDHKPARSELRREAINMSVLDNDYPPALADVADPTDDEIWDLEDELDEEEYVPDGSRELDFDFDEYDGYDPYDAEYDRY